MKNTLWAICAICLLTLAACGSNYVYQQEKTFANGVWTYRDSAVFEFDIQDTTLLYNLYFNMAAQPTFEHENMYVHLHTAFPSGLRMSKVRSFDVFDPQGNMLGKGSAPATQHIMLQENTFFNQLGKYRIVVEQYMREDSISGIQSVGLDVERTKAKK